MEQRIIDKIKKCLRLAKSSNSHEAARAMAQAQKLMAMHGITDADVALSDVASGTASVGKVRRPASHLTNLALMVGGVFGCESVIESEGRTSIWNTKVRFIGIGQSADLACYAYDVLRRQLERDRRGFIQAGLPAYLGKQTKTRRADLFALAWVEQVKEKVHRINPSDEQRALVARWKENHYCQDLERTSGRSHKFKRTDTSAAVAGAKAGSRAQLHAGVSTPRAPGRLAASLTPAEGGDTL